MDPSLTDPKDIDQIEDRRPKNADLDAIYLLTPEQYVVDCLMADLEARRYRKAYLLWTSSRCSHSCHDMVLRHSSTRPCSSE